MAFDGKEFRGPNGVNVAEILRVADLVERSETFDMQTTFHDEGCGTPGCIAGHVLAMHPDRVGGVLGCDLAGEVLGLSALQVQRLMMPKLEVADFEQERGERGFITNAHAAAVLRHLAATGEVDWVGTKPKAEG